MESVIKWRTGEPTKKDGYIVTMNDGSITLDYHQDGNWFIHDEGIIAWCPLSEIKPYKK